MKNNSIWENYKYPKDFPKLTKDIDCDCLIIGAGITGLSCAYELMDQYSNIVVVDQNKIYQGTTSSTTAKITYQHGYIYKDLIETHGEKNAKKYYEFNKTGVNRIEEIVKKHNIDCDFQRVNSYLFASNESENQSIEKEYEAYQEIGIESEITTIDERISPYKALKVQNQANFNISKYLKAITDIITSNGIIIYEGTRIVDTYGYNPVYAKTDENYVIKAKEIIICNHYPIYKGFNFYFMKMIPQLSYSIVTNADVNIEFENANYINTASPTVALRYIIDDNKKRRLNISGSTHDAKEFKQSLGQINILKAFGENNLGINPNDYEYSWCAQDYCTTDYIPLVGRIKSHFYFAGSYNEWGMAAAAASSLLIKDLTNKTHNEFEVLFDPCRVTFNKKLFSYNLKMVSTLLKTRNIPKTYPLIGDVGTGKVAKVNGKRLGIYKDLNHELIIVDVTCPHMHCGLRWNPLEKTYDCKCHGSRFTYEGKLLDGPARRNLYRLDFDDLKEYFKKENEK